MKSTDELKAALAEKEMQCQVLAGILSNEYKKLYETYYKIAPKLGLKPFGKSQIIYATSQEEADSIKPGESIFKFIIKALEE